MTTQAQKFRKLADDLRRSLGTIHPAVDEVVAACKLMYDMPQTLTEINASATADFETLKTLEKHLKYAVNAAKQLQFVDGATAVVAELVKTQSFVVDNKTRLSKAGGRPKKRGQALLANGIKGALSRCQVPERNRGSIIRICFAALEFPPSEAESAIKFVSKLKRKKPPIK